MRTLVDIPEKEIQSLSELCKKHKISRAEAVRRAISHYLKYVERPENLSAYFGRWKHRPVDALARQSQLRAEWK